MIGPIRIPPSHAVRTPARAGGIPAPDPRGAGFARELDRALGEREVTFSAHASERLARRGLRITEGDRQRIGEAVRSVGSRGGRNSLVLLGDVALIVNVPSRTVVTALGTGAPGDKVFTNIDSAVIA
ncbi:MAG: TIGR02530 family flagellar biosynthesis protein [Deltaproteobacteria bacterium]